MPLVDPSLVTTTSKASKVTTTLEEVSFFLFGVVAIKSGKRTMKQLAQDQKRSGVRVWCV